MNIRMYKNNLTRKNFKRVFSFYKHSDFRKYLIGLEKNSRQYFSSRTFGFGKIQEQISVHFQIYEKWVSIVCNATGNNDLKKLSANVVRKRYRVCEVHFHCSDYFVIRNTERRLKKDSVPQIG